MKTLVIDTAFRGGRLGVAIDGRITVEREVEAGHLESETFVIPHDVTTVLLAKVP